MLDLTLIKPIIQSALEEDIGRGDITTEAIISPSSYYGRAEIIAEEEGILAGIEVAKEVFQMVSSEGAKFSHGLKDKAILTKGKSILILETDVLSIFKGERVALNFLTRLSGIATLTKKYVDLASPFGVKVFDTRKTTPNLRNLEKYAVRIGGGFNHRFGLDSGVLIKDNHIEMCGGVKKAVERARRRVSSLLKIEVEVDNFSDVKETIEAKVDVIMLDNMRIEEIKEAVRLIRKEKRKILIEASGGVSLENITDIARTGIDLVSVGRLTHSAKSLSMSLHVSEKGR